MAPARSGKITKKKVDSDLLDDLGSAAPALSTLGILQDKIKRDPEAYRTDFDAQLTHFEAALGTLLLSPQKPNKEFNEQFMFITQCVPYYCEDKADFPKKLIGLLEEHMEVRKFLKNVRFMSTS